MLSKVSVYDLILFGDLVAGKQGKGLMTFLK